MTRRSEYHNADLAEDIKLLSRIVGVLHTGPRTACYIWLGHYAFAIGGFSDHMDDFLQQEATI